MFVETSPVSDPFGSKVHLASCKFAMRARFRRTVTFEEAQRIGVTCLRCLPEGMG